MICSRCGNEIEEGKLFCPICGQEVQLVPDFDTFGEQYYQKKQETREIAEQEPQEPEKAKKPRKKKKNINPLIWGGITLVVCVACLLIFKNLVDERNHNSYSYQMNKADTAFTNKEYGKALNYLEQAMNLQPADENAIFLRAQVYVGLGKETEAIKDLEDLLAANPKAIAAYGVLLPLYENQNQQDKIKELMNSCGDEKLRKKYKEYISAPPSAVPAGGNYQNEVEVILTAEEGSKIYYTTDGSTATEESARYRGSIMISGEKTTTICAVAVNSKGIVSDPFTVTYVVSVESPEPPKITLSPGNYTTDMDTTIYLIVPEGCKAYYEFDEEPTPRSREYDDSKGIKMPEGEHTLYAIAENKYGKLSYTASQKYTLKDPDAEEEETEAYTDTETEEEKGN